LERIPGISSSVFTGSAFKYDGKTLETPFAFIQFDNDGYIASLVDKASGRELRKAGGEPLNVLLFGEDVPKDWDNWDLERDIVLGLKKVQGLVKREVITDGLVEIRLRSTYNVGDGTTLTQDMVCYADDPRIDFHTLVNWNSPHRLLKAGFDLDIAASFARNEIQYGSVKRPTTENNSLEIAKFEVCNYKWTDVSEPRFGAAVLNDCKYGVTVTNCNIRLSLHRGGTHPDFTGDKGEHEMTYSLLVHNGSFSAENTVKPAYELNIPVAAAKGEAKITPVIAIDADNVICEALKPAENGDGTVMRVYECEGARTTAKIKINTGAKKAFLTNMLEDEKEELTPENGELTLTFRPFEIKTIKF